MADQTLVSNVCRYVDNFAHGSSQWEGFPITVDVASEAILLGCKVELNTDLLLVV